MAVPCSPFHAAASIAKPSASARSTASPPPVMSSVRTAPTRASLRMRLRQVGAQAARHRGEKGRLVARVGQAEHGRRGRPPLAAPDPALAGDPGQRGERRRGRLELGQDQDIPSALADAADRSRSTTAAASVARKSARGVCRFAHSSRRVTGTPYIRAGVRRSGAIPTHSSSRYATTTCSSLPSPNALHHAVIHSWVTNGCSGPARSPRRCHGSASAASPAASRMISMRFRGGDAGRAESCPRSRPRRAPRASATSAYRSSVARTMRADGEAGPHEAGAAPSRPAGPASSRSARGAGRNVARASAAGSPEGQRRPDSPSPTTSP